MQYNNFSIPIFDVCARLLPYSISFAAISSSSLSFYVVHALAFVHVPSFLFSLFLCVWGGFFVHFIFGFHFLLFFFIFSSLYACFNVSNFLHIWGLDALFVSSSLHQTHIEVLFCEKLRCTIRFTLFSNRREEKNNFEKRIKCRSHVWRITHTIRAWLDLNFLFLPLLAPLTNSLTQSQLHFRSRIRKCHLLMPPLSSLHFFSSLLPLLFSLRKTFLPTELFYIVWR